MPELRVVHEDPRYALAVVGPIVIGRWHDAPTVNSVGRLGRLLDATAAEHGEVGYVALIRAGGPLPDAGAREKLVEAMHRTRTTIVAIAIVIDGPPLLASAIHAVLGGMNLIFKSPIPRKAFREDAEAVAWLVDRFGTRSTTWAGTLEAQLGKLRHRSVM